MCCHRQAHHLTQFSKEKKGSVRAVRAVGAVGAVGAVSILMGDYFS